MLFLACIAERSSKETETPNSELTAFLMDSVIGARTLGALSTNDQKWKALHPREPMKSPNRALSVIHSLCRDRNWKVYREPMKSPNRAFLSSLVVPGSGQYVGAKRGYLFLAADIALLVGYFITHSDAENTRDDYRNLVRDHVIFDGPGTFETWDPIEDFEHATLL